MEDCPDDRASHPHPGPVATVRAAAARVTRLLPEGHPVPEESWRRRHRSLSGALVLQAAVLLGLALALGREPLDAVALVMPLGLAAGVGSAADVHRRVRTVAVSLGLLGCSAVLVHLSEGATESYFHVFVMLALVTIYQEWPPLLVSMAAVWLHHAATVAIDPEAFVAHRSSAASWAVVHGIYAVATACAGMLAWRHDERERTRGQRVLDATAEGIYGIDLDGRITFANAALAALLGTTPEALLGRDEHAATGHGTAGGERHGRQGCPVCAAVEFAGGLPTSSATLATADGANLPVEMTATPVLERGVRTGTVVSVRDLTEQLALTDRALRDPLTGLPNRALLTDRLAKAVSRLDRSGGMLAVLFVDLDRFKVVNDSLGHSAGDALLLQAAERLRTSVRTPDTVARFGGDEFVVLCDGLGSERDVFVIAERIVASFAEPFDIDGTEVSASSSVGIAITRDAATEPSAILRDADAAMYRAKEGGRGRYELFDRGLRSRALRRLETESDLWRAIARDELVVHYQPVVDLRDGALLGVEALVRWEHPERGLVGPGEFIPVAEETGLIVPIGAWVLEEACAQVQRWRTALPACDHLGLAVNLSAVQLAQPGLAGTVASILATTGLPPALLTLEITESVLMDDVEASTRVMEEIKALGVAIAVDDFGTGYSSLAYLSRFPVDVLKIDRAFVAELGHGAQAWPIVTAIAGLAQALGLRTIAEGVETETQARALRALGCAHAQGFLFGRPAPANGLLSVLERGRVEVPAPGAAPAAAPGGPTPITQPDAAPVASGEPAPALRR
jgi:diguanylate cyclase (GGDEF)-like protein